MQAFRSGSGVWTDRHGGADRLAARCRSVSGPVCGGPHPGADGLSAGMAEEWSGLACRNAAFSELFSASSCFFRFFPCLLVLAVFLIYINI